MASTEELDAIFAQYRASSPEEKPAMKARWRAALLAHYRATIKRARKIISPKAECAAKCEVTIAHALWHVRRAAERDKSKLSRAEERKLFEKLAKTLRTAIDITIQLQLYDVRDPWVAATEDRLKWIDDTTYPSPQKGGPRKKSARIYAVWWAHGLLERYGNRPPTRDRLGKWHELARALFGNEEADLFDYLEDHHRYRHPDPAEEAALDAKFGFSFGPVDVDKKFGLPFPYDSDLPFPYRD
jgi:hypothetical protein